jgi:hypothetical protein
MEIARRARIRGPTEVDIVILENDTSVADRRPRFTTIYLPPCAFLVNA